MNAASVGLSRPTAARRTRPADQEISWPRFRLLRGSDISVSRVRRVKKTGGAGGPGNTEAQVGCPFLCPRLPGPPLVFSGLLIALCSLADCTVQRRFVIVPRI